MTTLEVLRAARALIDKPGKWVKGPLGWTDGPTCVSVAMCRVSDGCGGWGLAYKAFAEAVGCGTISLWNDAPERTHEDVMAAFDKAIAAEEAKAHADST